MAVGRGARRVMRIGRGALANALDAVGGASGAHGCAGRCTWLRERRCWWSEGGARWCKGRCWRREGHARWRGRGSWPGGREAWRSKPLAWQNRPRAWPNNGRLGFGRAIGVLGLGATTPRAWTGRFNRLVVHWHSGLVARRGLGMRWMEARGGWLGYQACAASGSRPLVACSGTGDRLSWTEAIEQQLVHGIGQSGAGR